MQFTGDQRFDGPGMPPSLSNGRADASHQGGPEKPKPSAPAPVPLAVGLSHLCRSI